MPVSNENRHDARVHSLRLAADMKTAPQFSCASMPVAIGIMRFFSKGMSSSIVCGGKTFLILQGEFHK